MKVFVSGGDYRIRNSVVINSEWRQWRVEGGNLVIFRHECTMDFALDNSICHVWCRLHRILASSCLNLSSSVSGSEIPVMVLSVIETVVLETGRRFAFYLLLNFNLGELCNIILQVLRG